MSMVLPTQRQKILDNWSGLDYKAKFDNVRSPVGIPLWVGEENQRRLRSYALLESYSRMRAATGSSKTPRRTAVVNTVTRSSSWRQL